ncbi:adenylate kinase-domain-containing protein [Parasitella parasitica]|nr:adenylate kinase-domain-containing protein [Parasitella parasitica]
MFRNIVRSSNRLALAQRSAASRLYSTAPPNKPNRPSVAAMLAVASMGFAAYYQIVQSREGNTMPRRKEFTTAQEEEALRQKKLAEVKAKREAQQLTPIPAFSPEEVTVVFVLGGPGAGKGTQCQNLTKDYGFVHLSAGDLLRSEQKREGSKYGELINNYIKDGLIVPMEVTIALLEQAMKEAMKEGKGNRFLIDGFPRKMDQAIKFEEVVVPSKLVLFFECPEEVMLQRLLKRGENSGRVDDNIESIRKRFVVFTETSMPVVDAYEKQSKVKKISCDQPVEQVYQHVKSIFDDMFSENK